MTPEQFLIFVNKGKMRGALSKIALDLGISAAAVGSWFAQKTAPTADNIRKMSQLYGVSEEVVRACFGDVRDFSEFEKKLETWNGGTLRGAKTKLAAALGVSDVTVSRWARGELRPSEELMQKLGGFFSCSTEELERIFNETGEKRAREKLNNYAPTLRGVPLTGQNTITLPILADVPAGLPDFSDRDVEMFIDIPRFMFAGADFVVKCIGDSLEPKLHKGDYCVVRKTSEPINGRPMVVKTESGVTMKIIKTLPDGRVQLWSTNNKYAPFTPETLTIIGLIIGSWSRLDRENLLPQF